ncbi:MAG: M20/M25/M40 family metallo-hydrolase, partial [Bacteroidales bacterium]|nr:M20/M25/M40 family metallo-hydrolase [Bacteroidales bacterium]
MKKHFVGVFAILLFVAPLAAQQSLSDDIAFIIKREAFQNSQMGALASLMTDYAGPRLAASKLAERGEALAKEKLYELGFSNARIEKAADFPRGGWDNLKTYAAMTAPYYCNFMATPKAWSGSTDGLVQGEVVLLEITTMDDIAKFKGKLGNKIVLMPETSKYEMSFGPFATRHTDEQLAQMATDPRPQPARPFRFQLSGAAMELLMGIRALLAEEQPAVIVSGSGFFNVPRSTSVQYAKHGDPEPIAELVLPVEDHGRMVRLIAAKIPVSMEVEVKNEFYDNPVINNVVAEIPGTDPKLKDQVVLIGGHLDSWHGGTGAADNASGCIVMMEALRIIKASGIQPRRTIRIALWGGEEQGLIGSRGYMQELLYDAVQNKPRKGYDQFALYLNMDNGSGKFRGIYLEENDMAFPFLKEWSKPLESMGFTTFSPRRTGGTDHMSFDRIGLPAFQFIQDDLEYGRGYHTPMDTYER